MTAGLVIATLTIFTRTCFRVAELSGGFSGHLFNDEVIFLILEGPMISIAVIAMTALHPTIAFQGMWADSNWPLRGRKQLKSSSREAGDVEMVAVEPIKMQGR